MHSKCCAIFPVPVGSFFSLNKSLKECWVMMGTKVPKFPLSNPGKTKSNDQESDPSQALPFSDFSQNLPSS